MKMNPPTHAELFIATSCQHCPVVFKELSGQLKNGVLASLSVSNIAVDNTKAEKLNIRSVPWFSLENDHSFMIFSGQHSPNEMQKWITTSLANDGMQEYISNHLKSGQLMTVVQAIQIKPVMFSHVINMISDEETSMDLRIGLDVLVENFSETKVLQEHSDALKEIVNSDNTRLVIDALHYIALTGDIQNKEFLLNKSKTKNDQVRSAAIEALETLEYLIKD